MRDVSFLIFHLLTAPAKLDPCGIYLPSPPQSTAQVETPKSTLLVDYITPILVIQASIF
jgi:hypothetical protein